MKTSILLVSLALALLMLSNGAFAWEYDGGLHLNEINRDFQVQQQIQQQQIIERHRFNELKQLQQEQNDMQQQQLNMQRRSLQLQQQNLIWSQPLILIQ